MNAEVYASPDGWRFRIRSSGNGEIMAVGEAYVRRIDAEHALSTLFTGHPVDVTVRNHHNEVVAHYTLRPPLPFLETVEKDDSEEEESDKSALWDEGSLE